MQIGMGFPSFADTNEKVYGQHDYCRCNAKYEQLKYKIMSYKCNGDHLKFEFIYCSKCAMSIHSPYTRSNSILREFGLMYLMLNRAAKLLHFKFIESYKRFKASCKASSKITM